MENQFETVVQKSYKLDATKYSEQLVEFLGDNKRFFFYDKDDYVINFLVNNHSERIPSSWYDSLRRLSYENFLRMILFGETQPHFPTSLKEYVEKSIHYRLDWKALSEKNEKVSRKMNFGDLLNGMKDKKKYEVVCLGKYIGDVCKKTNCDVVLNLGCGSGYLSHFLTFEYKLKVIGIDCNQKVLIKSEKATKKLESTLKKKANYFRIHSHIDSNISVEDFMKIIEPEITENDRIALIGLHTCGNLAITTSKIFLSGKQFQVMINVPCCYHKLREGDFPLSKTVRNILLKKEDFGTLTNGGFHLATQSIQKWFDANVTWKVKEEDESESEGEEEEKENFVFHCEGAKHHCKVHSLRCALELFLDQNVRKMGRNREMTLPFVIGNIPKKHTNEFSSYVLHALSKILSKKREEYEVSKTVMRKLKKDKIKEFRKELDDFYEKFSGEGGMVINEVKMFWMLRSLLAPLLENIILVDRFFYMREEGEEIELETDWFELFDSRISPRNKVLIGMKKP